MVFMPRVAVLAVVSLYAGLLRGIKVALAFNGKMGVWDGRLAKGATGNVGRLSLFDVALHCIRRSILDAKVPDQEVYTFVHTWDVDSAPLLQRSLKPTRAIFEQQIYFTYPQDLRQPYVTRDTQYPTPINNIPNATMPKCLGRPCPVDNYYLFALTSQWWSRMRVLQLIRQYEIDKDETFDMVHLMRFDMCICQPTPMRYLPQMTGKKLYVGFMTTFLEPPGHNKKLFRPGKEPLSPSLDGTVPEDGSIVTGGVRMEIPRFGDTDIMGTSEALLRLASGAVRNGWNMSINEGRTDPHSGLGGQLVRLFHHWEVETECRWVKPFNNWPDSTGNWNDSSPERCHRVAPLGSGRRNALLFVRREMPDCRTSFKTPRECFNYYCLPPDGPPLPPTPPPSSPPPASSPPPSLPPPPSSPPPPPRLQRMCEERCVPVEQGWVGGWLSSKKCKKVQECRNVPINETKRTGEAAQHRVSTNSTKHYTGPQPQKKSTQPPPKAPRKIPSKQELYNRYKMVA